MRYRRFGRTGRHVSVIAGNETWPTSVADKGLRLGINYWYKSSQAGGTAAREPGDLSKLIHKHKLRKSAIVEFCHMCGRCEESCPHGIPITQRIKHLQVLFT